MFIIKKNIYIYIIKINTFNNLILYYILYNIINNKLGIGDWYLKKKLIKYNKI